jgi:hypothetical protein
VKESRGGRTATGAALCGRIACSERINLVGGRGWGWRCQAYFWECTDLITIEFAVCSKRETVSKELAKKKKKYICGNMGCGLNRQKKIKGKGSQKGDMIPDGPYDGSQRESKKSKGKPLFHDNHEGWIYRRSLLI